MGSCFIESAQHDCGRSEVTWYTDNKCTTRSMEITDGQTFHQFLSRLVVPYQHCWVPH